MIKGKLKKTLKEKCPFCKKQLHLRIIEEKAIKNGLEVIRKREIIICSSEDCDYEEEQNLKISRKREYRTEE